MIAQHINLTKLTMPSVSPFLSGLIPERFVNEPGFFSAALLHEVRNPLTNITLAVEMLQSGVTGELQKTYLEIITRASFRINGLITDLVRHQQPGLLQHNKYSLNHLMDEVMFMASDRLLVKNINVTKVYSSRDCQATGDRPAMLIALTNIVINAIDAMKKENSLLKVVTHYLDGRYIIQVEDNGCGICEANLKHIFKPYYSSKKNGLGIGLAATKDILKANKVRVHVESEPGVGTKFTLSFPVESPVFPSEMIGNTQG